MGRARAIDDILPLTPLQEGLLFHSMYDEHGPDVYIPQLMVDIQGELDTGALHAAFHGLLDRHASLRAGFRQRKSGEWVQVIAGSVRLPWREGDRKSVGEGRG